MRWTLALLTSAVLSTTAMAQSSVDLATPAAPVGMATVVPLSAQSEVQLNSATGDLVPGGASAADTATTDKLTEARKARLARRAALTRSATRTREAVDQPEPRRTTAVGESDSGPRRTYAVASSGRALARIWVPAF